MTRDFPWLLWTWPLGYFHRKRKQTSKHLNPPPTNFLLYTLIPDNSPVSYYHLYIYWIESLFLFTHFTYNTVYKVLTLVPHFIVRNLFLRWLGVKVAYVLQWKSSDSSYSDDCVVNYLVVIGHHPNSNPALNQLPTYPPPGMYCIIITRTVLIKSKLIDCWESQCWTQFSILHPVSVENWGSVTENLDSGNLRDSKH